MSLWGGPGIWDVICAFHKLVLCCTGVFAVGYVTMGKERVVLIVLCERGKNRRVVVLCSSVGLGIPSWRRAAVSSSQQA